MNTAASEQIVGVEPERRFLRDAEQRLAKTKRKAIAYVVLAFVIVVTLLYVTKDSPRRAANPMKFSLPFVAIFALIVVRQALDIGKARQYVASSRKALADAEAGVVYADNFCG